MPGLGAPVGPGGRKELPKSPHVDGGSSTEPRSLVEELPAARAGTTGPIQEVKWNRTGTLGIK